MVLEKLEYASVACSLHIDFSKGSRTIKLSGFRNESRSIEMLEAKDYDRVHMVSPSIRAIVNKCCDLNDSSVTLPYVQYVKGKHTAD